MATIKEVARLAGVSVGTVSHVITKSTLVSEGLRAKVEAAIRELDYHPNHVARSLKTSRTRTLGIIVPDMMISFFPKLIHGAETAARERGYSLMASNSYESQERQTDLLALYRSQRVEGILLVMAAGHAPIAQASKLVEAGISIVSLDRSMNQNLFDSVSVDNEAAARMGVEHLLARGYRRVAVVTGPLSLRNERERLRGYKNGLKRAGRAVQDELIWTASLRQDEVAKLCGERLARGRKPDAILSTNGPAGLGVLQALRDGGLRTPEDLGFVAFDELTVGDLFRPAITTIVQPAFEIGARACEILLGRIQGELPVGKLLKESLPAHLEVRATTQRKRILKTGSSRLH